MALEDFGEADLFAVIDAQQGKNRTAATRIGDVMLQAETAQHERYIDRLADNAPTRRVQHLSYHNQTRPRYQTLHVGEKLLSPRALLTYRVLGAGKAALGSTAPAKKGVNHFWVAFEVLGVEVAESEVAKALDLEQSPLGDLLETHAPFRVMSSGDRFTAQDL